MQQALAPNPKYFALHGEGSGEKAGALIRNADRILESKFLLTKRNVICMSIVSEFAKRCGAESAYLNGEKSGKVQGLILKGEFSSEEMKLIERICRIEYAGELFLAVRSSAHGDAAGTGIYESYYSKNDPETVARFVKMVIASHYSEDARLFRHDAGLEDGIAVIIEPLIAQEMQVENGSGKVFAPRLSGYAFSQLIPNGIYAGVVYGLAAEYVKDPLQGQVFKMGDMVRPLESLVFDSTGKVHAYEFATSFKNHTVCIDTDGMLGSEKVDVQLPRDYTLGDLLEKLTVLSSKDYKTYVEWAARSNDKWQMEYYVHQIAEIQPLNYVFDSDASQLNPRFLAYGDSVRGEGHLQSDYIVHIKSDKGWGQLYDIYGRYKRNFLLFEGSSVQMWTFKGAPYTMFSNSTAICELGDFGRLSYIAVHFGGMLAMVHKVLMSANDDSKIKQLFEAAEKVHSNHEVDVYQVPVELFASERQNKAALLLREK